MNHQLLSELKSGEKGERLNLKGAWQWILNEMEYEDFKAFAKIEFIKMSPGYTFSYRYMVSKETDSPKAREEYIKYLMYKLVQNLDTDGVRLWGR